MDWNDQGAAVTPYLPLTYTPYIFVSIRMNLGAGGRLYRFGGAGDKEMDDLLTKRPTSVRTQFCTDVYSGGASCTLLSVCLLVLDIRECMLSIAEAPGRTVDLPSDLTHQQSLVLQASDENANDLWIASTPNPYEWAFGDTVSGARITHDITLLFSRVQRRIPGFVCGGGYAIHLLYIGTYTLRSHHTTHTHSSLLERTHR